MIIFVEAFLCTRAKLNENVRCNLLNDQIADISPIIRDKAHFRIRYQLYHVDTKISTSNKLQPNHECWSLWFRSAGNRSIEVFFRPWNQTKAAVNVMDLNISGFAEEFSDMNYTGVSWYFSLFSTFRSEQIDFFPFCMNKKFGDWIFDYMDPLDYWKAHPSYVLCEAIFIFGAITMIIHCMHSTFFESCQFG